MKTTINLPDNLIQQAKEAARETHETFADFVADAVRAAVGKRHRGLRQRKFKIFPSGKRGLMPGVNLDDTSALLDIMDGIDQD